MHDATNVGRKTYGGSNPLGGTTIRIETIIVGVDMGSKRLGTCNICQYIVFIGEKSGRYIGHKPGCKNYGTEKLD
jgi:hypothetical protein